MRLYLFLLYPPVALIQAAVSLVACIAFIPIWAYLVLTDSALDECPPLPVLE